MKNYLFTLGIDFVVELTLPEKYNRVGGIPRFVFRYDRLFPAGGKVREYHDQIKAERQRERILLG